MPLSGTPVATGRDSVLNNDRRVPIMADRKAGLLLALSPDQDMEPSPQNRGQERFTCEAVRRIHMRVRSADTVLMSQTKGSQTYGAPCLPPTPIVAQLTLLTKLVTRAKRWAYLRRLAQEVLRLVPHRPTHSKL